MKYIAFTCHLPLEEFDYLENKLQQYNIGSYIIGHETTPFSHYHFCVQMEDTDYHNFSQAVFKKKYSLRGRAQKDLPRQYGKVNEINNLDKMKSYTCKDGNFRTNLSADEIKEIYEKSFKKVDKKTELDKLFEYLDKEKFGDNKTEQWVYGYLETTTESIRDQLLDAIYEYIFTRDNSLSLSKTAINNYFLKYLRITELYSTKKKIEIARAFNFH